MQPYKTTSDFGTSYYEIQKSKFYTYTAHVENEAAAREFVQGIKKKHFDARHNCSAWILGTDSKNPTMTGSLEELREILYWKL